MNETIHTDAYGFGIRDELTLTDWLNAEPDDFGEYIHVIYEDDTRTLRLYRSVGETGDNERVLTILEDVSISINDDQRDERTVEYWYLTWTEAHTLMTWLTALNRERSPAHVSLEYWAESGKPMLEDTPIGEENLICQYRTDSGRENWANIVSTYKNEMHMMASFE